MANCERIKQPQADIKPLKAGPAYKLTPKMTST